MTAGRSHRGPQACRDAAAADRLRSPVSNTPNDAAPSSPSGVSVFVAGSGNHPCPSGVGYGGHVHPPGQGICLSGRSGRVVYASSVGLATVHHQRCSVLSRGRRRRGGSLWQPRQHEYRSGQSVHQSGLYRLSQGAGHPYP